MFCEINFSILAMITILVFFMIMPKTGKVGNVLDQNSIDTMTCPMNDSSISINNYDFEPKFFTYYQEPLKKHLNIENHFISIKMLMKEYRSGFV